MYDRRIRAQALKLIASGMSQNAASKQLGVSRAAIRDWLRDPTPKVTGRTAVPDVKALDPWAYAHLLGLYLGDGHIAAMRRGVHQLRITCDDKYPRIIAEASLSTHRVRPLARVFLNPQVGCTNVCSYWKHWPTVLPQHGPGPKHRRRIALEPWQRDIVEIEPGRFLRGLFHSDGCRVMNWTVQTVAGKPKRYEYPRYHFSNESKDIIGICTWALDLVGIPWRLPRRNVVSVARREGIAAMDSFVGPKT
jgi:Homeodomain-like domain-containing protein